MCKIQMFATLRRVWKRCLKMCSQSIPRDVNKERCFCGTRTCQFHQSIPGITRGRSPPAYDTYDLRVLGLKMLRTVEFDMSNGQYFW